MMHGDGNDGVYIKKQSDEVSMHGIRGMGMWVMNGGEMRKRIWGMGLEDE